MTTLESICNVIFYVIAGVVAIGFTVYAKKALKGLENEDNMETDDVFDSGMMHTQGGEREIRRALLKLLKQLNDFD
ncbi:hypothetical protein L1987_01395 [Smallanthus sonchifolius]|uniref:Uncharacterized protein n=1 Tax=Smallanthus sonchifolius TaxID=185202 RepID=A0ACB9K4Z9_9ASTR|nr:hypothetical protein L1987_01395 [Smallanthus sonchifolius]